MAEPFALAADAAAELEQSLGGGHEVALVLGSGWGDALDVLGTVTAEVDAPSLPGFPEPTVEGHGGRILSMDVAGRRALVFQGRVHLYEGHPVATLVHGVRVAAAAGCRAIVLTNAAGSINPAFPVGTPVLISDHLNLTGTSPLIGPEPPEPHQVRFVDLTEAYSGRLRALARSVDPDVGEGVYAGLHGPNYETPAEIRMLQTIGADLVGMSTVLEAIAARHVGLEVLGVSLVTNQAAGMAPEALDHEEVLSAGGAAGGRVGALLRGVIEQL